MLPEARERVKAKDRQRVAGPAAGRGKKKTASDNLSEALEDTGQTRDFTAAQVGWSHTTLTKAKAVVEAARADPDNDDLQGFVEEMDTIAI
jgi:hypothetical protein